jgi:hypothetical protein
MPSSIRWVAPLVVLSALSPTHASEPRLVKVSKIWDQGPHNAFTDLIRWRDRWYCTFREADAHVGGNGRLRVLSSADGERWESVALIAEDGIDLRDPKVSITPDDRLMIVAGGSVYQGTTLIGRQPRVLFSSDGREWTTPQKVLSEGEWLWRVTWRSGKAYGVSYNASARQEPQAQAASKTGMVRPGPADWKLKLFESADGVAYNLVTHLDVPGHPNETTLRFVSNDDMIALVRREGGNTFGWIGTSPPPYTRWQWREISHRLGGPNFLLLPDGSLWAAGRSYPGGAKTVLARMSLDRYEPVLTLPSGGDTSYPGLVWDEGQLWMSYYSSHEGKSAIYLARIRVPLHAEPIGSRLEPFVDDHLIERFERDAQLQIQRPEPHEVVLVADQPWEGNTSGYVTVFLDGNRYRMYYRGSHFDEQTQKSTHREVTCYAESRDGLAWTKPELGLFGFEGSKRNNIVWDGPGTHNFTPFLDTNPACPPEARYKALGRSSGGLIAFRSADGLHWEPLADQPLITQGAFDSQNLAFWDAHLRKYREYHRAFRGVRDIMTGTSDDFLDWTEPVFLDYPGVTLEHLYTNAVQPCPRAPHILIGFPTRFLPATQQTEPTFMASRDGKTFRRYLDAVIPRTAPENRDGNRSNYMTWGVLQLPGRERELSVYATEAYYAGPGGRIRRFTYRLDGFVSLHSGHEGGSALTRPIRFEGSKLVINTRAGTNGQVRIALVDEDGNSLDGFSVENCDEIRGDDIARTVTWRGNHDVSRLAGRAIRLHIFVTDADIFSFRFE